MPGTLIGEPLFNMPFLNIKERMMPGDPGTPLKLYPKLAATPNKIKASRSMTKLVMQTDIRIEDLPAIGNPTENVPTAGLRLIHWNDRWILFGNTGSSPPRLYERSGPVYLRTNAYPNADWPTNTSFSFAAFSKAGRFMYAVKANDLQNVQVYQWSGVDELDPSGQWELKTPLAIGSNVVGLEISPLNNFLIVKTAANTTKLYDIQNLNAAVTPASLPVGNFLAMLPTELEWVFSITGSTANVYSFNLGTRVFTLVNALTGSTGTLRNATYSPDLLVLTINGRATAGTAMPRHYARKNGLWTLITTGTHATATTWDVTKLAYKTDSTQAFFTHTDGGSKAEFLERVIVTPDVLVDGGAAPYASGGSPTSGNVPQRNGAGTMVATANNVYSYNTVTGVFTNVTPAGYATATGYSLSRDGLWLMKCTTTAITLWTWNGTAWVTATAPGAPGLQTLRNVSLSNDGQFCALTMNATLGGAGNCRIFQRNVGTGAWTQLGADIALGANGATAPNSLRIVPIWHPTRNDILVFPGYGGVGSGLAPRFFRLITGTWTETVGAFPYQAGYNQLFGGSVWTANGLFLNMYVRNNVGSGYSLHCFAFNDAANTFSLYQFLAATYSGTPFHTTISPDNKMMAVAVAGAGTVSVCFFANTGTLAAPVWSVYTTPGSAVTTNATGIAWTADNVAVFSNTVVIDYYLYSQFATYPSYQPLYTFTAPSGASLPPNDGYNLTNTTANFGGSAWAQHPYTTTFTPVTYPPSLGFAPQYAITAVWAYQLSFTGKIALYETVNGVGIATRPNTASIFLNTETLRAAFVELYDRTANTFNLRSYSIHLIDSIIKDFQFAPNEEVLAYHVIPPVGAPGDTIQGRLIYDISLTKFDYRGNVYAAGMTNSLMAFSPFSTEFVVTHEHLVTGTPIISLHEFGANYIFANQDTRPVPFGPPDFSACNDVVVAHGGSPPMSFFIHDDPANLLTPNPVTIDWAYTGVILAIAFRDDCGGLVVVTPDTVTTLEEAGDDWVEEDTEDLDEPIEPPTLPEHEWPDVYWEPDQIEITRDPLTDPNYPGTFDPTDLTNISYVPYTVVSVTFRVASVAQ